MSQSGRRQFIPQRLRQQVSDLALAGRAADVRASGRRPRSEARSERSNCAPTCGPLPWVITRRYPRRMRSTNRPGRAPGIGQLLGDGSLFTRPDQRVAAHAQVQLAGVRRCVCAGSLFAVRFSLSCVSAFRLQSRPRRVTSPTSSSSRIGSRTGCMLRRASDFISSSMMAFCACSRFSACWKTNDRGESITSSVTSSPRCAGRQCRKIASGFASPNSVRVHLVGQRRSALRASASAS